MDSQRSCDIKDASSLSPILCNAQDLCESVYVLAGVSPKRVLLFRMHKKEMSALLVISDTDDSQETLS